MTFHCCCWFHTSNNIHFTSLTRKRVTLSRGPLLLHTEHCFLITCPKQTQWSWEVSREFVFGWPLLSALSALFAAQRPVIKPQKSLSCNFLFLTNTSNKTMYLSSSATFVVVLFYVSWTGNSKADSLTPKYTSPSPPNSKLEANSSKSGQLIFSLFQLNN